MNNRKPKWIVPVTTYARDGFPERLTKVPVYGNFKCMWTAQSAGVAKLAWMRSNKMSHPKVPHYGYGIVDYAHRPGKPAHENDCCKSDCHCNEWLG